MKGYVTENVGDSQRTLLWKLHCFLNLLTLSFTKVEFKITFSYKFKQKYYNFISQAEFHE